MKNACGRSKGSVARYLDERRGLKAPFFFLMLLSLSEYVPKTLSAKKTSQLELKGLQKNFIKLSSSHSLLPVKNSTVN